MFQKLLTPEIESCQIRWCLFTQSPCLVSNVDFPGLQELEGFQDVSGGQMHKPSNRYKPLQIIKRSDSALMQALLQDSLDRKEIDCSETLVEKMASRLSEPGIVD